MDHGRGGPSKRSLGLSMIEKIGQNLSSDAEAEAEADSEQGPVRSHSSQSQSHEHDVSSLSEWQTSGITKSELLYKQRHQGQDVSTGSFSMRIDMNEDRQRSSQRTVHGQYRRSSMDDENVGYIDIQEILSPIQLTHDDLGAGRSSTAVPRSTVPEKASTSTIANGSKVTRATQAVAAINNYGLPPIQKHVKAEDKQKRPSKSPYFIDTSDEIETPQSQAELPTHVSPPSRAVPPSRPLQHSRRLPHVTESRPLPTRSSLNSACNVILELVERAGQVGTSGADVDAAIRRHRDGHMKRFKDELSFSSSSSHSSSSRDSYKDLMDKINALVDVCILNYKIPEVSSSSEPSDNNGRHRGRRSSKSSNVNLLDKKILKPPVTFTVPFSNCRCQQQGYQGELHGPHDHDDYNAQYQYHQGPMIPVPSKTTLREVYEMNHPQVAKTMEKRQESLDKMKENRMTRGQIKRDWVKNHPNGDLTGLSNVLPPKLPSVITPAEMRRINQRKVNRLLEVQRRIADKALKEERHTNRLMAEQYAHKLQKKVLKGQRNFHPSESIITG